MLLPLIETKSGCTFDWRAIQKSTFSTNCSEKLNGTSSMSLDFVGGKGENFCIGKRAPGEAARSSMQNFLGILGN